MNIRVKAAHAGRKQYLGAECKRNPDHGRKRYTSSGQCVQCANDAATTRTKDRKSVV